MRNKLSLNVLKILSLGLGVAVVLAGCTEVRQVAEGVAGEVGGGHAAGAVRGGSTLVSGLSAIGHQQERSMWPALALQCVARYTGVSDQPELTRYGSLLGRAVA